MTHSKDCLYHLEQSFLDCTCGEKSEGDNRKLASQMREAAQGDDWPWMACLLNKAADRISTPTPLTPSDEMVEVGLAAAEAVVMETMFGEFKTEGQTFDSSFTDDFKDRFRLMHRVALQAALNLMGGKK